MYHNSHDKVKKKEVTEDFSESTSTSGRGCEYLLERVVLVRWNCRFAIYIYTLVSSSERYRLQKLPMLDTASNRGCTLKRGDQRKRLINKPNSLRLILLNFALI